MHILFRIQSHPYIFALSESDADHPASAFCPSAHVSPRDLSDCDAEEEEGSGSWNPEPGGSRAQSTARLAWEWRAEASASAPSSRRRSWSPAANLPDAPLPSPLCLCFHSPLV